MAGIPPREEILKLPRLARVAFAARCARRAQPFFKGNWPDAPATAAQSLAAAIELAENFSRGILFSSKEIADVCDDAGDAARGSQPAAADAAYAALESARAVDEEFVPCYCQAIHANRAATSALRASVKSTEIVSDFEKLDAAARKGRWTDYTPVPVAFFEPMEPGEYFRKAVEPTLDQIRGLFLSFSFPADAEPAEIRESIVGLYRAANQLHMARGNGVLDPDKFQQTIAGFLAPVHSA